MKHPSFFLCFPLLLSLSCAFDTELSSPITSTNTPSDNNNRIIDKRDLILGWFTPASSNPQVKAFISGLESIAANGQQCSAYASASTRAIDAFIDPLEVLMVDLVDVTAQLLRMTQPVVLALDSILQLLNFIPALGNTAYQAIKYVFRVDLLLQTVDPILQGFSDAMSFSFNVARLVNDGLKTVASTIQIAADVASSSAAVAVGVVGCCDALPGINTVCRNAIANFCTNEYVAPVIETVRTAVAVCPAVLGTTLSLLPDFGFLQELSTALHDIVEFSGPFIDVLLGFMNILGLTGDTSRPGAGMVRSCCTIRGQAIHLAAHVEEYQSLMNDCNITETAIEPMHRLMTDVMPQLTTQLAQRQNQRGGSLVFSLPMVNLGEGISSDNFACTFANNEWPIQFEMKEYNISFPSLSLFSNDVDQVINTPDPLEGRTFVEDSDPANACSQQKFGADGDNNCCFSN